MAARPVVSRTRLLPAVVLAVVGLLVSGCTAHRLSQAQDAFSKAAEQENTLLPLEAPPLYAYASPYNLYLQADGILTKDTADKTGDLRKEKLLGTAYALHAMTLWRLTDLSTTSEAYRRRALEAKQKALDPELQDQLGPRDRVMMTVLPSLMDHDTGMQHLASGNWRRAHDFFESAFTGVDDAIKSAPQNHDVRAYLYMVEIQTLLGWRSAQLNAPADQLSQAAKDECRSRWFIPKLQTAVQELGKIRKARGAESAEAVWDSTFVRSRLEATGFDVATVKDSTVPAATRCEWRT